MNSIKMNRYPKLLLIGVLALTLYLTWTNDAYTQSCDSCPCSAHARVKCTKEGNLRESCIKKWTMECENARATAEKMYKEFCVQGNPRSGECKNATFLKKDICEQTSCY